MRASLCAVQPMLRPGVVWAGLPCPIPRWQAPMLWHSTSPAVPRGAFCWAPDTETNGVARRFVGGLPPMPEPVPRGGSLVLGSDAAAASSFGSSAMADELMLFLALFAALIVVLAEWWSRRKP